MASISAHYIPHYDQPSLKQPETDHAALPVILAGVLELESLPREDTRCIGKIKPAFVECRLAFLRVISDLHGNYCGHKNWRRQAANGGLQENGGKEIGAQQFIVPPSLHIKVIYGASAPEFAKINDLPAHRHNSASIMYPKRSRVTASRTLLDGVHAARA